MEGLSHPTISGVGQDEKWGSLMEARRCSHGGLEVRVSFRIMRMFGGHVGQEVGVGHIGRDGG